MLLQVWDNGGISFDRYTVRIRNDYYGMSTNPQSPQGFNQYIGAYPDIDETGLGAPVSQASYNTLSLEVRQAIAARS